MIRDVHYAIRNLLKHPGFAIIAVFTLAVGIGANTCIFGVAKSLLLNPFPFPDLDRLVILRESFPGAGLKGTAVSPADFVDWKKSEVFQGMAAYRIKDVAITGTSQPETVRAGLVSAEFFSVLGVSPHQGRPLRPDEDQPGSDRVVMLGYGIWMRNYAGDPNIVNKAIELNGQSVTVVGVLPAGFDFPFGSDLWMPLALSPAQLNQRDIRNLQVVARLDPGTNVPQAREKMLAVASRLEQENPQTNAGLKLEVIPLRDQQGDFTRPMLSILFGMAVFLLLIACINVANLMFAHGQSRQKEFAIRAAIGARRWLLVRQLMTEGFLLSCLAGILGVLLAAWGLELIKTSLPPDIIRFMPGWNEMGIDWSALLFALGLASITTIVFSSVPALRASRPDLNRALKNGAKSSESKSQSRSRSFLVASEVALALVLLAGAGLMVKGFRAVFFIFEASQPEGILTLQTTLPDSKYKDQRSVAEFYRQVMERLKVLPQVKSASAASNTPLNNSPNPSAELIIEGQPSLRPGERRSADVMVISPDYFSTIKARVNSGRDFSESDRMGSPPVAIISETAARRYWPKEDPLGRRFKRGGSNADSDWLTIVGVVGDVKQAWFDREIRPQVYLSYFQQPRAKMSFLLRTTTDPMSVATAARSEVLAVDSQQPVDDIKTLAQLFADETSPLRFATWLMSVFGVIALILAAVGVYSVMSYTTAQRTREMGIRIAFGARSRDVLNLVLRRGLFTVSLGLGIGLPLALALGRIMSSLLFGVVPLEFGILIGLVSLMSAVALVATYIPARRAARVDPIVALRTE